MLCPRDMKLQTVIHILELTHIVLGVFVPPVYRITRGGRLAPNIGLGWGLVILWGVIWCMVLPALFTQNKEIFVLFPESHGMIALLLTGWLPSAVVCAGAYAVIVLMRKRKK